jgi:hypothetical protein
MNENTVKTYTLQHWIYSGLQGVFSFFHSFSQSKQYQILLKNGNGKPNSNIDKTITYPVFLFKATLSELQLGQIVSIFKFKIQDLIYSEIHL